MHYHVRITREYSLISESIRRISECAEKYAWFEHTPDQGCQRTHVHGILFNVTNTKSEAPDKTWRNWIKKELDVKDFDRNDWYFKTHFKDKSTKTFIDITEESVPKAITYMSKGVLKPVLTNYDSDIIDVATSNWVRPRVATPQEIEESIKNATVKERYTVFQLQNDAIVEVQDICKSVSELDFNTKMLISDKVKALCFEKKFRVHEKFIVEVCQAITAFYFPEYFNSRIASRF